MQQKTPDTTIIKTADGSHTLYVPELNEHYHSIHGAINESEHIFIRTGLHQVLKNKNEIAVLEIGFGTGLNAFLTCIEANKMNVKVDYTGIEYYPLNTDKNLQLNYSSLIENNKYDDYFRKIISSEWEKSQVINSFFTLTKVKEDVTIYSPEVDHFDLVYFDAFAPDVQPEMWTEQVFAKLFHSMKNNSIFVTYSSKGVVKRALKSCGFDVVKVPGPKGKREIVSAFKH
jgi:tRNA U34 5-methylaminomethyl-2-thiouridine-forming methyltransferase MnmC